MKRLLPFLALLSFLLLISVVVDTYGVFESNVAVETEIGVAGWQFLINGTELTTEVTTFEINELNWTEQYNVAPGKASPGHEGYFEVIIDPTGSEVAIDYELAVDFASLNNSFITITSVTNSLGNPLDEIEPEKYNGMISLEDALLGKVETIRVDFAWVNDESNNDSDSIYVNQASPELAIPVSLRLLQYIE